MEEHPRQETEEKRVYARRKLRNVAEQLLKRHGQPSPPFPGMDIDLQSKDVQVRFADGNWASLVSLEDTVVIINVYATEDPLGPLTQYKSFRPGEFKRHDVNPQAFHESSEEAARKGPLAAMSHAVVSSLSGGLNMVLNEQEGLDGSPITAQDANDLLERLKDAHVERY